MNELISFGGEVKAMGGGRIAGQLVQYSTADAPDLSRHRDFFSAKTDFDMEDGKKASVYYHHGLDGTLGARKLGTVEMKANDLGVWVEGQLNMRDDYERAVYGLAEAGKLGWSSGATTHLVRREAVSGKNASHVTYWPISEASLTPTPADHRNAAVVPVESLAVKSFLELTTGQPGGEPAKKDFVFVAEPPYLGENFAQGVSYSATSDLSDRLSWFMIELLSSDLPAPEKLRILGEAADEFKATLLSVVQSLLSAAPETAEAKSFQEALTTGRGTTAVVDEIKRLPTSEFLRSMGAVVADSQRRLSWYDDERAMKQGRPFSQDSINSMTTMRDAMLTHADTLTSMINRKPGSTGGKGDDPKGSGDVGGNGSGNDGDSQSISGGSGGSLESEFTRFHSNRFSHLAQAVDNR